MSLEPSRRGENLDKLWLFHVINRRHSPMAPKKKAPAKKKATAVKGGVAKKSAAKAAPEVTAEIPKGGVLIEACKS